MNQNILINHGRFSLKWGTFKMTFISISSWAQKQTNKPLPSLGVVAEVLTLTFDIMSQEIDAKLMEQYRGIEEILKKSLKLLKALARGNDVVQMRMFERLDTLLEIKVVESELSVALKEVGLGIHIWSVYRSVFER